MDSFRRARLEKLPHRVRPPPKVTAALTAALTAPLTAALTAALNCVRFAVAEMKTRMGSRPGKRAKREPPAGCYVQIIPCSSNTHCNSSSTV